MIGGALADLAKWIVATVAERGKAWKTTEAWQDKRPHIAAWTVGCFDWVFWPSAHIVRERRDVCSSELPRNINVDCTSHRIS
ncbi:hypothetical protein [Sinorhizobium meliloti]|uniref:hypothetical protein n=1 Tax=Rhizobium meliloti TaxID=382 RepID=UPI000FD98D25|nr:hypothetical protein [Sinorhizobium meliloti]RVM14255.1 hypothetical protein CN134_17465 [Sinorhizobium meliloti]RVO29830.1 hypothetical protein CN098_17075 [Sinorhizobium meliloti]RVO48351.1 hypothetical protein CN092_31355 [Sinorhizobium meliloti]